MNGTTTGQAGQAIVAIAEPARRAMVWRSMTDHGHHVRRVRSDDALISAVENDRPAVVAVHAASPDVVRTAQLLRELSAVDPRCRLIVAHEDDDAASASVALRYGAHPCPVPVLAPSGATVQHRQVRARLDEILSRRLSTDPLVAVDMARRALELATDRQLLAATLELSRITGADAAIAGAEHFTEASAAILRRIAQRSRFPVPAHLLLERLAVPTDAEIGVCFTMVQRAAFRVAGVDVPLEEIVSAHGHHGVLFGAFHSTAALVRFSAQRWWRSPRSVLDELRAAPRHLAPR